MTPQCAQAVAQAAGRALKKSELDAIDARLRRTASQLARTDPNWRGLPPDDRTLRAAQEAMKQVQAEADKKVARAKMQILKTIQMQDRMVAATADGEKRSHALVEDINHTDGYIQAIKHDALGGLLDLVNAARSTEGAGIGRRISMFLFDAENPRMSRDLISEIFSNADGSTGNKTAKKGAEAWLKTIESLRQRFNASGGDVGQLDYGYIPQPHDTVRIRGAGDAKAQQQWVADTLPLLDRSRYLHEDGSRMNDAEVGVMLSKAWETLSSDGLNKMTPGEFKGTGMRANAGSESRDIHFRDGNAYFDYMNKYGGGSAYDAMTAHIGGMARSIGLVERYGPNPNAQMRLQFEMAAKADGRKVDDLPRTFGSRPQSYWNMVNGTASTPSNARLAQIGMMARSLESAGKLQSTLLSSITDLPFLFITTGYNKLSYFDLIKNIGEVAKSSETRDFLTMHGIIAESMSADLQRWAGDNLRADLPSKLANSTQKLSLLRAWSDTLRRGFSLTMMSGMARLAKTDWAGLSEYDRFRLTQHGIDENDWNVVRATQPTQYKGQEFITPDSIRAGGDPRANEVLTKVMAMIVDESESAIINPDLKAKTAASWGGLQRGTPTGEFARAVMQFKSFPMAIITRHWQRMLDTPGGPLGGGALQGTPLAANKLAYSAALTLTTTALGAIAVQASQIKDGKDPIDMSKPKFWFQAAMKGGGLSFVGDMLLTDPTDGFGNAGANALKTLSGPTLGSLFDLMYSVGIKNAYLASHGKETHVGAEALNLVRGHLPFVNLWYAKSAIDHAVMHSIQENLSPGYLGRMQQRAQQEFAQQYYWQPNSGDIFHGTMTGPERAPNLAKAVGQ
jgi:hypothetical protein